MARMFPEHVADWSTPGECEVYNFLKLAARPDSSHLAWYSPDIEDREPDFVLLSPDCGLIVLEVKDWLLKQILELDPKTALLQIGNRTERRKQPLAQAREYVNHLLSLFSKKGPKLADGKAGLPCPVSWGAVFPHITRQDWKNSPFHKVLDATKIIFWDDLQKESPLFEDYSGKTFREWLRAHFPPRFPFEMTASKMDMIRDLVFPIARIQLPPRGAASGQIQEKTVRVLDQEQENLARDLGNGNLLLDGPAGSGKTLVLAARAWNLPRVNRKMKRLLITCFNLSLSGYIKRLIASRGAKLGCDGIEVIPFYNLCELIIGEKLEHKEGLEYYELVVRECLERLASGSPYKGAWDAILVDEGQDFSTPMAEIILKLLPEHGLLTVARDNNQRLYKDTGTAWEEMAAAALRPIRLERQYRNTRQIATFADNFVGIKNSHTVGAAGKKPEIFNTDDLNGQLEKIAETARELIDAGQPMSEIAILYFSSRYGQRLLPEAIMAALEKKGILSRWLSRDISSKKFYDITTDSVTISSVHSVKGMDFANVFLTGFEKISPDNRYLRHLAYVGMTRARERLFICSQGDPPEAKQPR